MASKRREVDNKGTYLFRARQVTRKKGLGKKQVKNGRY
jgi:hypothetical protein